MWVRMLMFMMGMSAFSLDAVGGYHTFTNNTDDMDFHVSVLYVAGTYTSKGVVHHKGAVDKNGKPLSNTWTANGVLLCVKRVDIRKAGSNPKLLEIHVYNVDTLTAADSKSRGGYGYRSSIFNHTLPTITCSLDSHWVFSGSKGNYKLELKQRQMNDLPMYWNFSA